MFLAVISPSSSCSSYTLETSEVSAILVFTMKTTQPRFQVFSVNGALTCRRLHFWRHFLIKQKILPNLVISNWLGWIMCVLLSNQNWGNNYFEWIIIFSYWSLLSTRVLFPFFVICHYYQYIEALSGHPLDMKKVFLFGAGCFQERFSVQELAQLEINIENAKTS